MTAIADVNRLVELDDFFAPAKQFGDYLHVFDYSGDCYGSYLTVQFVDKIRDDIKFDSFAAMAEQIGRDCISARGILTFEY